MPLITITTVITNNEKKKQRFGKPEKHKNLATQRLFFLEHIILGLAKWRNRSIPTQFRTSESTHSVMKMTMEWP